MKSTANQKGPNNNFYGKHHTVESKRKIGKGVRKHFKEFGYNLSPEGLNSVTERNQSRCKGKTFEEIYGPKQAAKLKKHLSDVNTGSKNPMYGMCGKLSPTFGRTGKKHPFYGKHHSDASKEKMRQSIKELWKDSEFVERMLKKRNVKPTKPELIVNDLLDELSLPFRYSGDGDFWIGCKETGFMNPDFINQEEGMIIEVFGFYWHDFNEVPQRIKNLKRFGWETLIIWDYELENLEVVAEHITNWYNEVKNAV